MKTESVDRRKGPLDPVVIVPTHFDIKGAIHARKEANGLYKNYSSDMSSLKLAAALAFYNFDHSHLSQDAQAKAMLLERLKALGETELHAKTLEQLPTVGIEVETPRKVFDKKRDDLIPRYRDFFDAIRMPRNRINRDSNIIKHQVLQWEFSPNPSYSAAVQARIISELIQGRFIPSLSNSQDPNTIQDLLDRNLVSLHINIGIPHDFSFLRNDIKDLENAAIALALAYTSPIRLSERKSHGNPYASLRDAENTLKSDRRIELKAMEVRSSDTYRALTAAQIFFTGFLSQKKEPESALAYEVKKAISFIGYIFKNYRFSVGANTQRNNEAVSSLAKETPIGHEIRDILSLATKNMQKILSQKPTVDSEESQRSQEA